jgi:hypothetical protein
MAAKIEQIRETTTNNREKSLLEVRKNMAKRLFISMTAKEKPGRTKIDVAEAI